MENLYGMFSQQVYKNPDKVAVIFNNIKISYLEFKRKVDSICDVIEQLKISGEGIIVAIPRKIELIATLLAVSNTNNFYIPLDIECPKERIQYIINNSNSNFVICEKADVHMFIGLRCIFLDDFDLEKDENRSDLVIKKNLSIDEITYCLYTSGSTGYPKGVLIKEAALINFIYGIAEAINFEKVSTIACLTTQSFDIFFLESIMALCIGLTVILSTDNEGRNPSKICSLLTKYHVDVIQITPSRAKMIMEYDSILESFKELKIILIGGENFPFNLLGRLQMLTNARIFNLYGPTETTIWSTVCELTKRNKISLGNPICNTEIYILDEKNQEMIAGVPGELCIGGAGLAIGYMNEPQLTKEKFINWKDTYIYKTGDYAIQDAVTGEYEYLGRLDNQVKINGYRIELEEIEIIANRLAGITQCMAVVENNNELDFLTLYYIADKKIDERMIRSFLADFLPDCMIPNIFKKVKYFNYTSNGKINRKILPDYSCEDENYQESSFDTIFMTINKVIKNILDINIKKTDRFKEVGLNSIAFIKLLTELEDVYEIEFNEDDLAIDKYEDVNSLIDTINSLRGKETL